jgi:hypothetical protein
MSGGDSRSIVGILATTGSRRLWVSTPEEFHNCVFFAILRAPHIATMRYNRLAFLRQTWGSTEPARRL